MALPPYASGLKSIIVDAVTAETEGALTDLVTDATTQAARATLQSYLSSEPFADTTALNAYTNASLALNDSVIIPGDGRYMVTSLAPLTWTRQSDDSSKVAADKAALTAQIAAKATGVSYDINQWGYRTAPTTTTSVPNNYYDTIVVRKLIPAGTILSTAELPIGFSGATAIQLKLVRIAAGAATADPILSLDSQIIAATGDAVVVPLTLSGQPAVAPEDCYLAMRRPGVTTAARFAYFASVAGQTGVVAGDLTTNGQTLVSVNLAYPVKINGYQPRRSTDNNTRIGVLEALQGDQTLSTFSQGADPMARTGIINNNGVYVFPKSAIKRSGRVFAIVLNNVTTAGLFDFGVFSPSGVTWRSEQVFTCYASATGKNTFVAGTNFDPVLRLKKGWRLGIRPAGGAFQAAGASGQGANFLLVNAAPQVGQTYTLTAGTQSVELELQIESVSTPISTLMETWGERRRGYTPTHSEQFMDGAGSTPSGWTLNGWAVDANKRLISPATGSNSAIAYAAIPKYVTRHTSQCIFEFGNVMTTGWLGIGGNDSTMLVRFNAATQAIELCSWGGPGTAPTVTGTIPIINTATGAAFATAPGTVTGRRYMFQVRRRAARISCVFADLLTGERLAFSYIYAGLYRITGNRGFLFGAGTGVAGDIAISRADFGYDVSKQIHTLFVGDSITEGLTMPMLDLLDDNGGKFGGTFAHRFDAIRNMGDALAVAKGGINSTNGRIAMNDFLTTHYALGGTVQNAVVMLGTNDNTQATLETQLSGIVADLIARGITVYLCTIVPGGLAAGFYSTINANIRSKAYGNARVIDVNSVLTGGTGNTWIAAYNSGDNVHPSSAGHAAIVSCDANGTPTGQLVMDAPELFLGSYAGILPAYA